MCVIDIWDGIRNPNQELVGLIDTNGRIEEMLRNAAEPNRKNNGLQQNIGDITTLEESYVLKYCPNKICLPLTIPEF